MLFRSHVLGLLLVFGVPPLGREVLLAPGDHHPIRLLDAGRGMFSFILGHVQSGTQLSQRSVCAQLLVQIVQKAPDEMPSVLIGLVDQRVIGFDGLDAGMIKGFKVGITDPDGRSGRIHGKIKPPRIGQGDVPDGGGKNHQIAGTLMVLYDDSLTHLFYLHRLVGVHRTIQFVVCKPNRRKDFSNKNIFA